MAFNVIFFPVNCKPYLSDGSWKIEEKSIWIIKL